MDQSASFYRLYKKKKWICRNAYVCRLKHGDIAIYWPGMDTTPFLVIFTDPRECFNNVERCAKPFTNAKGKISVSVHTSTMY